MSLQRLLLVVKYHHSLNLRCQGSGAAWRSRWSSFGGGDDPGAWLRHGNQFAELIPSHEWKEMSLFLSVSMHMEID